MGGIILPILNGSPGLISVLRTGKSCPDPPRDWDQETQTQSGLETRSRSKNDGHGTPSGVSECGLELEGEGRAPYLTVRT